MELQKAHAELTGRTEQAYRHGVFVMGPIIAQQNAQLQTVRVKRLVRCHYDTAASTNFRVPCSFASVTSTNLGFVRRGDFS